MERLASGTLQTSLLKDNMTVAKLCYSITTAIPVFWSRCHPQDLCTQSCLFFPHCRYCYPLQTADGWKICQWSKLPGLSLWNMLFWVPVLHNQTLHISGEKKKKVEWRSKSLTAEKRVWLSQNLIYFQLAIYCLAQKSEVDHWSTDSKLNQQTHASPVQSDHYVCAPQFCTGHLTLSQRQSYRKYTVSKVA